ncbi:tautomerase pptA [Streptomyces sp. NPDC101393]|uniref:tautomerase pptA n=1 Tax=Streptomyces sp. NPDC101393 TaxID=3366141 RepID=UPI0037F1BBB2
MPHVTIKHFPHPLTPAQEERLLTRLTAAVREAFDVEDGVVSIALHPVEPEAWDERVYRPEIAGQREFVRKTPTY